MSEAAAEEGKVAKPKSKKLIIIIAAVVVLLGAGVGGWLFLAKKNAHADDEDAEAAPAAHAKAKTPPSFLPLDSMVVNLADPGGERMAQIGITIELSDAKAVDEVKKYMPSIRSAVLLLISQRTAAELLGREGKEKLAQDIKREVARPLGFAEEEHAAASAPKGEGKKKKAKSGEGEGGNPITGVLYTSFIVQ